MGGQTERSEEETDADKGSSRELRKVLCRRGYLTEILGGIPLSSSSLSASLHPSALNHADVCVNPFITSENARGTINRVAAIKTTRGKALAIVRRIFARQRTIRPHINIKYNWAKLPLDVTVPRN